MRRVLLGLGLLGLIGCGGEKPVQIRIRNVGDMEISRFWLGAGGTGPAAVPFGSIAPGETTGYRGFPAQLASYRKYDALTADTRRHLGVVYPEQHVGTPELAPGRYTFEVDPELGPTALRIIQD